MSKSLSILCTNCMVRGGLLRENFKICNIFILNAKKIDQHEAKVPISEGFSLFARSEKYLVGH